MKIQKEIEISSNLITLFISKKSFFVTVDAKFEIFEQRYNIREAFEKVS